MNRPDAAIQASDSEERPVRCPRCGYDQRGVVATWKDSCPLEGVCSECGLQYRWAEILRPEKFEPRWCVEFVPRSRGFPAACVKTFLRSFWPWGFWRRIRMSHEIRPRRLAIYAALLFLLPAVFTYVIGQSTVAICLRWQIGSDIAQQRSIIPGEIQFLRELQQSDRWEELSDRRQVNVLLQLQNYQAAANNPPAVNHSYVAAVIDAVLRPMSKRTSGRIREIRATIVYPPPATIHQRLAGRTGGRNMLEYGAVRLYALARFLAWWMIAYLLLPLCFVCLPVSRRRAKVRWRHLARIALYGLFIPATIIFADLLCIMLAPLSAATGNAAGPLIYFLTGYLTMAAVVVWWAAAIGRFLRMPHAWWVAILLSAIAALLPLTVAVMLELIF